MRHSSFTAVYDACVLYPAPLRDFLIRLGLSGRFRARWSAQIHDEWKRNLLLNRPDLTAEQLNRTSALMDRAIPDALVTGHEELIAGLTLPDIDDRHVLAAAIRCNASVIVTFNEKDFPAQVPRPVTLVKHLRLLGHDLSVLPDVNRRSVHTSHFSGSTSGTPHSATDTGSKALRLLGWLTSSGHGPLSSNLGLDSEFSYIAQ